MPHTLRATVASNDRTMVSGPGGTDGPVGGRQRSASSWSSRGVAAATARPRWLTRSFSPVGQLGGRHAARQEEDRVVAEAAGPASLACDRPLDDAGEDLDVRLGRTRDCDGKRADHACPAIDGVADRLEQPIGVAAPAPPGAAHAGTPVESGHLDPGVVGQRESPEARAYASALAIAFSA